MTDQLSADQLGRRLADAFRAAELPPAPARLRDALEQVVDLPVDGSGGEVRRSSRSGILGVLGIAAVLLVGGAIALGVGSRSPAPSIAPSPPGTSQLTLAIQWTAEVPRSDAIQTTIVTTLGARLVAAGIDGARVTASGSDQIAVSLPAGAPMELARALAVHIGRIAFVPLGSAEVAIGARVDPAQFPAIFEGGAVTSATTATGQSGEPTVEFQLDPAAAAAFGDYTAGHIGEAFAITVDGMVAVAPRINSEIRSGSVVIDFAGSAGDDQASLLAWLRTTPLPVALIEIGGGLQPSAMSSPPAPLPTEVAVASPSPSPLIDCEPPMQVEGPQLSCDEGIRMALTILPAVHPRIAKITFFHDCNDVRFIAADCLVQMFGVVTFTFADGSPPIRVSVSAGSQPQIIPDPFAS